jgi:pimeloyl-ACP methyl ester carboxylesterase
MAHGAVDRNPPMTKGVRESKMKLIAKRWIRRFVAFGILCFLAGIIFSLYVGHQLVAPVPRVIGPPPASLGGETVKFRSGSGSEIVGWLTENKGAKGSILLLHAIRADRRSMQDRAKFLHAMGYNTLCMDFQAHGESFGDHITLGYLEAMDAAAGVAYLRSRHDSLPVAVIGTSLGGAAALMATYEQAPEAMVVEAVFGDAEVAVGNRLDMRFGECGRLLSPLLTWQIQPLLGIELDSINTVRAAAKVKNPVFVIYGREDRHARPAESKSIYKAIKEPKEIWEISGAAHVDLHRFAGAEYEKRVGDFIAKCFKDLKSDGEAF